MADDPVEAREARAWQPHDDPMRTRTWASRGPAVEVYTQGEWRPARLLQRQDWADGTITYHVEIHLPGSHGPSYRVYVWDPRSVRPVAPGTKEPTERRWP